MNAKTSGSIVSNTTRSSAVSLRNVYNVREVNSWHGAPLFDTMDEHRRKSWNMHGNTTWRTGPSLGRSDQKMLKVWRSACSSSYSSTRTMAPPTNRSHRSPGSTIKNSETIESVRHHQHHHQQQQQQQRLPSGNTGELTDVYQQVYHDDSSTHGSRTLDSRFSRDKYDLSDEQQTDEDEDEPTQKSINGHPSASPTYVYRSSEPFHIDNSNAAEFQHPMDQIAKGK